MTDCFRVFINDKDIINVVIIENQASLNLATVASNNTVNNLFLKTHINICKEEHACCSHSDTVNLKIEFVIKVETVAVHNCIEKI